MAFGYLSGHSLLQKPFRTEAPLLMEIFQQVFNGATAAELAQAIAPPVTQRQPGQSRRVKIVRPKGDAQVTYLLLCCINSLVCILAQSWCTYQSLHTSICEKDDKSCPCSILTS